MNSKRIKTKFIVNPIAGGGITVDIIQIIKTLVNPDKFDIKIDFTCKPNEATLLSKQAVLNNFNLVVAVGGDGTVNECLQALIGTDVALGIIPTGSGNGFAYHFKIKRNISEALLQFNKNSSRMIDVGSINNFHFVNISGIGFDAHIAKLFANSKTRGFINYLKLCLKELKYKSKNYSINVNNKSFDIKAYAIVFANASQYGNDAKISPLSIVDDGLIDFVIVKDFPNWKIPYFIYQVLKGRTHLNKNVEIIRAKSMIIKTELPFVHVDGEVKELTNPITIKVNKEKIKIFAPNEK